MNYAEIKTFTFPIIISFKKLTVFKAFRLSTFYTMLFPCQNANQPIRRLDFIWRRNNQTSFSPASDICTCRIKHKSTHKSLNVIMSMPCASKISQNSSGMR